MSPGKLKSLLRPIISLAALGAIVYLVTADRSWRELFRVEASALVLAMALNLLAQAITAVRWTAIGQGYGFAFSMRRYFAWYFAGLFSSVFLPSTLGGDALRMIWISIADDPSRQDQPVSIRRWQAGTCVLWDRFLGLAALVILGIPSLLTTNAIEQGLQRLPSWLSPLNLVIGLTLLAIGLTMFIRNNQSPLGQALRQASSQALEALRRAKTHPALTALHGLYSLLIQLLGCTAVWVLAQGLDMGLSARAATDLFVISSLAILAPISINGVGVREAVFAWYFRHQGGDPIDGALLGLIFTVSHTLVSLSGALAFLRIINHPAPNPPN